MKAPMRWLVLLALLIVPAAFAQFTPTNQFVPFTGTTMIADINGDGLDDLVDRGTYRLALGGGTFGPSHNVAFTNEAIVATLDFNGDGLADVITLNTLPMLPAALLPPYSGPNFTLYRGNGNGTFTFVATLPGEPHVVDFNGDGKDDLILLTHSDNYLTFHAAFSRSNGDGTFTVTDRKDIPGPMLVTAPEIGGGSFSRVASGDLNGDGKLDIVFRSHQNIAFFFGKGDGTFDQTNRFLPDEVGGGALDVVDVDGDGNLDLIFTNYYYTEQLVAMFGDGTGHFPRTATYTVPGAIISDSNGGNFAVGHFTSAQPQIAIADDAGTLILLSAQSGQFRETTRSATGLHLPVSVMRGRFDNATSRDLLVSGFDKGNRDGEYQAEAFLAPPAATAHRRTAPGAVHAPRTAAPVAESQTLNVSIIGGCDSYSDEWTVTQEGFFCNATAKSGASLGVAFVNGVYQFELSGAKVPQVEKGTFVDASGTGYYVATAEGKDSCGKAVTYRMYMNR